MRGSCRSNPAPAEGGLLLKMSLELVPSWPFALGRFAKDVTASSYRDDRLRLEL